MIKQTNKNVSLLFQNKLNKNIFKVITQTNINKLLEMTQPYMHFHEDNHSPTLQKLKFKVWRKDSLVVQRRLFFGNLHPEKGQLDATGSNWHLQRIFSAPLPHQCPHPAQHLSTKIPRIQVLWAMAKCPSKMPTKYHGSRRVLLDFKIRIKNQVTLFKDYLSRFKSLIFHFNFQFHFQVS